ncbi:nucleic acid-binding, OB-fold protein [Vibrio phage 1.263.B._10N.286.51.B1]|nr:nucleic acid-binding, OB-fold protein [Vibrio phage 1.263.A._10N.286.51.B1]AUR99260.1 nucleic acid-binding, OB-fold protein [Vibrio phage 1.263.B._10N.286.51.B1]
MAHTVSGKLRKEPFIKTGCGPQGDSTMYAIELSEMIKSYNSDEKFYTNYSALFFAKTPAANDFYAKAFAEGSFVVVSCEKLKTDIQQGQDGRTFVKMQMENPRLEGAMPVSDMGGQPQQQQQSWGQPQQPQQAPMQNQQRAPQQQAQSQYNNPGMADEDIPFAPVGLQFGKKFMHVI